jgi:hypothetical protein
MIRSITNRFLILFFLVILLPDPGFSQELACQVIVNADQVQSTERAIFEEMETTFTQFMNNMKWTNDVYQMHERIRCNLNITINAMPSIGVFSANVQVQSVRPIFDTNYETIVLNFADRNFEFQYTESMPLEYVENTFNNNLVSMLSFYAYVIIGLDRDTFSKLGGNEFFNKALNISNLAQQSESSGWQPFDSNRNRYWLIENLTNSQLQGIREGLYNYHRMALDRFISDPEDARVQILGMLKEIEEVKDLYTNSILIISFFDAKTNELINIFKEGNIQVRRDAYNILVNVDPTKTERYKEIIQN